MNHRDTEGTENSKDPVTAGIINAAIEVHRTLGPGLLESAYEECLCHELSLRHIPFERQVQLPVTYKSVKLDCGFRIDILIPGKLVIELKAVEQLQPVHDAQLLTYLKLSGIRTGLILNFNVPLLRDGIRRLVL